MSAKWGYVTLAIGQVMLLTGAVGTPWTTASATDPLFKLVDFSPVFEFIKVFGFGFLIFFIWYGDYRKIAKLQKMIERYEALATAYGSLARETRDTMLLTMDVNAKLVAKLDFILNGKRGREGA